MVDFPSFPGSPVVQARPMPGEFDLLIERDEEGWLVASVPALQGCHRPVLWTSSWRT